MPRITLTPLKEILDAMPCLDEVFVVVLGELRGFSRKRHAGDLYSGDSVNVIGSVI
jgi:hypothetical protein